MQQINFKKLLAVDPHVTPAVIDLYSKYRPVSTQEIKQKTSRLKLLIWKDKTGDHSIDFTKDSSFYLTGLNDVLTLLHRSMQKITNFDDDQILVFKIILAIDDVDYSIEKREQHTKFTKEADSKLKSELKSAIQQTSYKVATRMCLSKLEDSLNINTGVTTRAWKTVSYSPAVIYSWVRTNVGKLINMIYSVEPSFMVANPKQRLDKIFDWLAIDAVTNDLYDKKIIAAVQADIRSLKIQLYKLPVPTIEPINIQAVIESQRVINENLSTLQARQLIIEKHITDIRQLQSTMFTFDSLQKKVNLLSDILKEQSEYLYAQSMKDYNHVFSASQVEITPDDEQFLLFREDKTVNAETITLATVAVELLSAELKNNPTQTDLSSKLQAAKQELALLNDIQTNRAKIKQRQKYLDYLETVKEERLKGEIIRLKSQIDAITLIQKELLPAAIEFKSSSVQDSKIIQSVAGVQNLLTLVKNSSVNSSLISKVSFELDAHLKQIIQHESDIKQDIEDNYGKLGKLSHLIIKHKKYLADKTEYDKQADVTRTEISNRELLLSCIKKRQLAIEFIREYIKNINRDLAVLINKYNIAHENKLPDVSYAIVDQGIKIINGPATTAQQTTIALMTKSIVNHASAFSFRVLFLLGDHPIADLAPNAYYCILDFLQERSNAIATADCKGPPTTYCIENPAEQLLNRLTEERKQIKAQAEEHKQNKAREEKKLLLEIKDSESTAKLVDQENKNTLLADDKEKTLKEREKIRLAMEAEQKDNLVLFAPKPKKPRAKPAKKT